MKQKEEKILGIIAIIFGTLALLGSWLPIISLLAFFFAIVAIGTGVFGIGLNINNRKSLAVIGTTLGILSVFLVLMTQVLPSGVFADLAKNFRHPYRSLTSLTEDEEFGKLPDYKSDEDNDEEDIEDTDAFPWTQNEFDALIEGDTTNRGKGGTNYKDIIKKHGLPDSEFDSTIGGYNTRKVTYLSIGDKIKTVTLTFAKDDNGQLLLVQKHAVGLGQGKSKQQNDSESRV